MGSVWTRKERSGPLDGVTIGLSGSYLVERWRGRSSSPVRGTSLVASSEVSLGPSTLYVLSVFGFVSRGADVTTYME
jgi:hypothetical protein